MEIQPALVRKLGRIAKTAIIIGKRCARLPINQETIRQAVLTTGHAGPLQRANIIEVTHQRSPGQIVRKSGLSRSFQNAVSNIHRSPASEQVGTIAVQIRMAHLDR